MSLETGGQLAAEREFPQVAFLLLQVVPERLLRLRAGQLQVQAFGIALFDQGGEQDIFAAQLTALRDEGWHLAGAIDDRDRCILDFVSLRPSPS